MNKERKSALLKEWALEAGFDLAGVAVLGPSEHGDAYWDWLERGDQGEMAYLERRVEERLDPRRLLDGDARSALCVALQYHPLAGEAAASGDLWPRVARYAHGEDYHLVMERRLRRLGERVEAAFPGIRSWTYVDTGPVLERELAARAGLGAIGKNTNLLNPERGSWLLLGELLLTMDLAPDVPFEDLCGSCTACLDACPTGALPAPYRLESRRCISYWTIEHRGAVPDAMREMLGDWVFGCDICQEVCPINEAVEPGTESRFRLPLERRQLDLAGLLRQSRDEYVERFRRSPMKRAKLDGLRRNAATAMGNRGGEAFVGPLAGGLRTGSLAVREHAAWALSTIGGVAARQALERALEAESDADAKSVLERALQGFSRLSSP